MNKIRYINLCIVEFSKKHGIPIVQSYNYLNDYDGLNFLDKHYEAEHLLPLEDTLTDIAAYCKRHGGVLA